MALTYYTFDASTLSSDDRIKLAALLDNLSFTGYRIVDTENKIYSAFFEETTNVFAIPFPEGTIITRIC